MKIRSFRIGIVLFSLMGISSSGFTQDNKLSAKEQGFISHLAQGNMSEIQLGRLAQQKASDQKVKDFGARMEKDHGALLNELKQWASAHQVALPSNLNSEQQQLQNRLAKLSGKEFDKAYISSMMKDHQKDIHEVQNIVTTSQNSDLRAFAAKALPFLENHIRVVENVAGNLGMSPSIGLNEPEHPMT